MKTKIKSIKWDKEVETKFGVMQQFIVTYDDHTASFLSKSKDNLPFKVDEEAEFTETSREYNGKTYFNIKPIKGQVGYNKAIKREQSKYSGFAMSYAKDLVINGIIELKQISEYTKKMFTLMVELDKTLEND